MNESAISEPAVSESAVSESAMSESAVNESAVMILRRRAERLARSGTENRRQVALRVTVLAIGKEKWAVPVDDLREIVPLPPVTSLPNLPAWMLGIVHLRGELFSVIDLALRYGLRSAYPEGGEERTRYLTILDARAAVGPGGDRIGDDRIGPLAFQADDVLGFREIYDDEWTQNFDMHGGTADGDRPIRAMTKDLIAILDTRRLLTDPALIIQADR